MSRAATGPVEMSVEEMRKRIEGGESVSWRGRILRHVNDVPTEEEAAGTPEEMRTALRTLDRQIEDLEGRRDTLAARLRQSEQHDAAARSADAAAEEARRAELSARGAGAVPPGTQPPAVAHVTREVTTAGGRRVERTGHQAAGTGSAPGNVEVRPADAPELTSASAPGAPAPASADTTADRQPGDTSGQDADAAGVQEQGGAEGTGGDAPEASGTTTPGEQPNTERNVAGGPAAARATATAPRAPRGGNAGRGGNR